MKLDPKVFLAAVIHEPWLWQGAPSMCPRTEWSTAHRTSESHALAFPDVLRPVPLPDCGSNSSSSQSLPKGRGRVQRTAPGPAHALGPVSDIHFFTCTHVHVLEQI